MNDADILLAAPEDADIILLDPAVPDVEEAGGGLSPFIFWRVKRPPVHHELIFQVLAVPSVKISSSSQPRGRSARWLEEDFLELI